MKAKSRDLLEFLLIAAFLGAVFLADPGKIPFVGDESMWISRSNNLELYFSGQFRLMMHDPSPSIAMSMPTIPEYLVGLSRRIGGYRPADLNGMYSYGETFEQNEAEGNVPSSGLLWWSRFLPSLLGALSILLVFYLIKAARDSLAAYVWLILALINGFLVLSLRLAMSEAPLMCSLAMAAFAGYAAMYDFKADAPLQLKSLVWITLFGVFAGLAGQSKNNGLAILPAGIAILVLLTTRIRQDGLARIKFFGIGLSGITLATFLFFVGPNPLLWKHPIQSSLALVPYRIGLMQRQAQLDPRAVINGWQGWLQLVPNQIFNRLTPLNFFASPYIKGLLAFLGLCVLVAGVLRAWSAGRVDAGGITLLGTGLTASLPALFTPLNWDRYFLIPVFFVTILMAIGVESILRALWRLPSRQKKLLTHQIIQDDKVSVDGRASSGGS